MKSGLILCVQKIFPDELSGIITINFCYNQQRIITILNLTYSKNLKTIVLNEKNKV